MNSVVLTGRFTDDPKVSETNSGKKIARFTLAVDRVKEGTDFINCMAWEKNAEFVQKYCHKGVKYLVEGRIQTGSYEKDGRKVYTTDIVVTNVEFLEKKADTQPANPTDEFMKIPDGIDNEIPFA
ncbi:MAG: single-stranded DNA-binding protein [Lachnospiraceae bacterium]|nr:single-stranded DNA-binding protein [Lachnospiraceae bacterium]